ncbi:spindle pole body component 110 [Nasonia vitripennis]|uniref:Transcription factor TFIIIC triple barrel domain-containing protein n=1 Tax=Nasonia vitripennis TaxID=7425 RepID=A0A7M7GML2_NASVI|nr:spindle pole body component 110 [Nasonia vitripennis]
MSNSDSELEEDEEEILVYVEFDSCATNDVFSSPNLKLDMLGLDSDHPVMQVNGKFFEGTYEDAVGTYMFFDKDNNPTIDDPVFDKVPTIKYFQKTRKVLKMQRAFVMPRYEVLGDSEHSRSVPNMDTIKEAGIPMKYQEEALEFWKNTRDKRMEALHEYLRKQQFRKELRSHGFEPESESDEDNPFAMYKYAEDEADVSKSSENKKSSVDLESQIKNLENTLQKTELANKEAEAVPKKLTVIDPGPSTSKSSQPWIDEENAQEQKMSKKVKSVGKVREKTMKGRVQKKSWRKRKLSSAHKNLDENSIEQSLLETSINIDVNKDDTHHLDNDTSNENVKTTRENRRTEKLKEIENIKSEMEEMEIDENAEEESGKLLSEELGMADAFMTEKNKRKQEKREAKMREISEKLKALSQCPSQLDS